MTVIAWDGKRLAADKQATDGGGIARTITKIERFDGEVPSLIAMTGGWDVASEMRAWWKAGANPDDFPPKARDDVATLIVIKGGIVSTYACGPYAMVIEAAQCAFGSGRDFAEAAMYLGHDAVEAVKVACQFQSDCGNGIDVLEL